MAAPLRLGYAVLLLVAAGSSAVEDRSSCAGQGVCPQATAAAVLAEQQATAEAFTSLLQRGATGSAAAGKEALKALKVRSTGDNRRNLGNASVNVSVVHGSEDECNKFTGTTCIISECDSATAAECSVGGCTCPEYMCSDPAGRCVLSAAEVAKSVAKGMGWPDVEEKLNKVAGQVPGASDSMGDAVMGTIGGVMNSAGQVLSGVLGLEGSCGSYVSTCMFGGCTDSVAMTATCTYGVCSCKENFCYGEFGGKPQCNFDIEKVFGR